MMFFVPAISSVFYVIEYRSYFTQFMVTAVGAVGASEQLVLVMGFTLYCFMCPDSNDVY